MDVSTTTAYELCKCFDCDMIPGISVLRDYWGENIQNEEIIRLIYGVYKGLYLWKGVTADLFHKCFTANKLDELIHKKYKHKKSQYYCEFVEKDIIIGNTHDLRDSEDENDDTEEFDILDDNICPNCSKPNFTLNYIKNAPQDCARCCKMICNLCSYYDKKHGSNICFQCSNSSLETNIKNKLKHYKETDVSKFGREGNLTIDDISQLLKKQRFTCYVCDEMVLTSKWKRFCCYQFSVDRIDNNLPHDRSNVLISCYYCNCRYHFEFNQINKVCNEGCHIEPKNIISRTDVDRNKIKELLLAP